MSLSNLIAAQSARLTPTERRIAEAVLADPTLLAFGTVSDLAERVGTSRPSVVRFATKLGCAGYSDLQEQVRDGLSAQLLRPSERIRRDEREAPSSRSALEAALRTVFEEADRRLPELAAPIVAANRVWVLSGETSRAGAHAFASKLSIVRPGVHLVDEPTGGLELAGAGPGDAAVVFDFSRYRRRTVTLARHLVEQGVELVAITDGPLSPLAALTEIRCELAIPAVGPFDSSLPAVAMAELIVAEAASRLRDGARERIDRLEALWEAGQTFAP